LLGADWQLPLGPAKAVATVTVMSKATLIDLIRSLFPTPWV
jgi:hypothetical protein